MATSVVFLLVATLTLQVAPRSAPQISYLKEEITETASSSAHHHYLKGGDIKNEDTCFVVSMSRDETSFSIYERHKNNEQMLHMRDNGGFYTHNFRGVTVGNDSIVNDGISKSNRSMGIGGNDDIGKSNRRMSTGGNDGIGKSNRTMGTGSNDDIGKSNRRMSTGGNDDIGKSNRTMGIGGNDDTGKSNRSMGIGGEGIGSVGINRFSIRSNVNTSSNGDSYRSILSGNYFKINYREVRAQVISPKRHQEIKICDKSVLVNNEVVSNDVKTLGAEPTYQKREDGSMWYTNLKVGTEMTAEEIEEFKRKVKQIEARIERALEKAKKQREAALEHSEIMKETANRQMEGASEMRRRMRGEARRQKETASGMERRMKEEASWRMERGSETERIMGEEARRQMEIASEMERRMRDVARSQMKAVSDMERGIRGDAMQWEMEHEIAEGTWKR